MKGTKVFGFITVLVFLGIPAIVSGESIEKCTNDYINAAAQITNANANDFCDLTKTYLRCISGNGDVALTSSQRSQLKEKIEQTFRQLNVRCDKSAEEMIEAAGFRNGSIKVSGTLSGLTLTFFAVVMSALVGTLY